MVDACQGVLLDAAAPRMEAEKDAEDWEVVPVDIEEHCKDGLEGRRDKDALRDVQHCDGVVRTGWPTGSEDCGGKGDHGEDITLRMNWSMARPFLEFGIVIWGPPLLALIEKAVEGQPQIVVPLLTDVIAPPLIVLESLVYIFPEWAMYRCIPALGQINRTGLFAVGLLIHIVYTAWLFVSCEANLSLAASGFEVLKYRLQVSAALRNLEKYSSCIVCLPRKLPDLYGLETCARSVSYELLPGLSKGDPLWKQPRQCEVLATLEHVGALQLIQNTYGAHMTLFALLDAVAFCVWACALGVVLWTTLNMLMFLYDDIEAVQLIYTLYTLKLRNGAASRREAFNEALLDSFAFIRQVFDVEDAKMVRLDDIQEPGAAASVEGDT